jgi:hypothetical protein
MTSQPSAHASIPDAVIATRELLVRIANEVGFPKPRPEQGLAQWSDDVLDGVLQRGSAAWAEAHELALSALEAALLGCEEAVRAALVDARDVARSAGRREPCSCPTDARGHRLTDGRCIKCGAAW